MNKLIKKQKEQYQQIKQCEVVKGRGIKRDDSESRGKMAPTSAVYLSHFNKKIHATELATNCLCLGFLTFVTVT